MSVYDEIKKERDYQEERWGHDLDDSRNTPWMWAAYIGQYATRWMVGSFAPLKREVTNDFRTCMIKVATLAIAAVESLDRQREKDETAFYEE